MIINIEGGFIDTFSGEATYKTFSSFLNMNLLKKVGISENQETVKNILFFHLKRNKLFYKASNTNNPIDLKKIANEQKEIEFKLQELWGFPKDENKHRFWEIPKCSCLKHENNKRWENNQPLIIDLNCSIHGHLENDVLLEIGVNKKYD